MPLLSPLTPEYRRRLIYVCAAAAACLLIAAGIFAKNGWFPRTDAMNGKRFGWFGKPLAKNAPSSWNPLPLPTATPSPTPYQLSKEYIHAGSKLVSVEDKDANAIPPADLAIWRPSTGVWWVQNPATGSVWTTATWGTSGDIPVPGDYDGDGTTDFAVVRPGTGSCPCSSTWYLTISSTASNTNFTFGSTGDIPAPADYDGDGKTDAAYFRPSTGVWYIKGSTAGDYNQSWGSNGDKPAPADYDGDGKSDLGVFRPSDKKFYSINSANSSLQTIDGSLGSGTYVPVCSDYDGDGKDDYAVFDQGSGNWYVRWSTTGSFVTTSWGASNDIPVFNDYDADGKCDLAVWTNSGTDEGRWHIKNSSDSSTRNVTWGEEDDNPVPAYYRR